MGVTPAAHQPGAAARAFALAGTALFAGSIGYFVWFYLVGLARRDGSMPAAAAIALNTAAFTLFALHHSIFARAPIRAWVARTVSPHLERAVYVWIASVAFALLCAIWAPFGAPLWDVDGGARVALHLAQLAGAGITLHAAAVLDAMSLSGVRQLHAPLPASGVEPSSAPLRHTGLYGLVRHPIYLGWLLIVWPAPTMTPAHLLFAGLSTVYLVVAIAFEERSLHQTFGAAYADYTRRVPSKLIPWIF